MLVARSNDNGLNKLTIEFGFSNKLDHMWYSYSISCLETTAGKVKRFMSWIFGYSIKLKIDPYDKKKELYINKKAFFHELTKQVIVVQSEVVYEEEEYDAEIALIHKRISEDEKKKYQKLFKQRTYSPSEIVDCVEIINRNRTVMVLAKGIQLDK